jgi:hypothetical protein
LFAGIAVARVRRSKCARGLVGDQTTKVAAGGESVWEPGRVDAVSLQRRAKRRLVLAQTVELAFVDMDAG